MQNRDVEPLPAVLEIFVNHAEYTRPNITGISSENEARLVRDYISTLAYVCEQIGLPFLYSSADLNEVIDNYTEGIFQEVEIFVNKRRIDLQIMKSDLLTRSKVGLDARWITEIRSHCIVIRSIIDRSDVTPIFKEAILEKLNHFAVEVDQGNTRLESVTATIVSLCEAISTGTTALEPAVRMLEHITGALARLIRLEPMLALPPPNELGLALPGHF